MKQFNEWLLNEEKKEDGHWGYHLMLDMSGVDQKASKSKETIAKFLKELVPAIDMIASGAPVIKYLIPEQPNAGFSAMQLIETSSITFHFADKKKIAFLDVFSCKPFDPKTVKEVVDKYFSPKKTKEKFVYRDAP